MLEGVSKQFLTNSLSVSHNQIIFALIKKCGSKTFGVILSKGVGSYYYKLLTHFKKCVTSIKFSHIP